MIYSVNKKLKGVVDEYIWAMNYRLKYNDMLIGIGLNAAMHSKHLRKMSWWDEMGNNCRKLPHVNGWFLNWINSTSRHTNVEILLEIGVDINTLIFYMWTCSSLHMQYMWILLPPPMRLCFCQTLSVCQQDNSKSYGRIFLKFSGIVGNGKIYKWFNLSLIHISEPTRPY